MQMREQKSSIKKSQTIFYCNFDKLINLSRVLTVKGTLYIYPWQRILTIAVYFLMLSWERAVVNYGTMALGYYGYGCWHGVSSHSVVTLQMCECDCCRHHCVHVSQHQCVHCPLTGQCQLSVCQTCVSVSEGPCYEGNKMSRIVIRRRCASFLWLQFLNVKVRVKNNNTNLNPGHIYITTSQGFCK